MRFPILQITFWGGCLSLGCMLPVALAAEERSDEASIIAEIKECGGQVSVPSVVAGQPRLNVRFTSREITVEDIALLERLPSLRSVTLLVWGGNRRFRMTDSVLVSLSSLKQIEGLYISNYEMGDAALERLKELKQLRSLGLTGTQVTDAGLEHLTGMTELRVLQLGNTSITDKGLAHLKAFPELEHLELDKTAVTDDGLAHLKELKNLRRLELNGTQVTAAGLEHLRELPKLTVVFAIGSKVRPGEASKTLPGVRVRIYPPCP